MARPHRTAPANSDAVLAAECPSTWTLCRLHQIAQRNAAGSVFFSRLLFTAPREDWPQQQSRYLERESHENFGLITVRLEDVDDILLVRPVSITEFGRNLQETNIDPHSACEHKTVGTGTETIEQIAEATVCPTQPNVGPNSVSGKLIFREKRKIPRPLLKSPSGPTREANL